MDMFQEQAETQSPFMSSLSIDPRFIKMYDYEVDDTEKKIIINIPIAEGFDSNLLKVELHNGRSDILVEAPEMPPFLKGKLLVPVLSIDKHINSERIRITLTKVEKAVWEIPIIDNYLDTEEIDPKSAFLLGLTPSRIQSEVIKAMNFLIKSSSMGYVPSMCFLARFYLTTKEIASKDAGMEIYQIAIDKYQSPMAMVSLGEYLLKENVLRRSYGLSLLRKAAEQDYEPAHLVLGMALSPLSKIKGIKKDIDEAIKELELAGDSPEALHELAMLYYNGVGVTKDLVRANELQLKARRLNKRIEPLSKQKAGAGTRLVLLSICMCASFVIGFAVNEYIKKFGK